MYHEPNVIFICISYPEVFCGSKIITSTSYYSQVNINRQKFKVLLFLKNFSPSPTLFRYLPYSRLDNCSPVILGDDTKLYYMSIHKDLKYKSHVLTGILTEPKKRLINSLNLCICEGPLMGTLDYTYMSNTYFSVLNNYIQNHSTSCSGICGYVSISGYYSPGRNVLCLQDEFAKFFG